MTKTETLQIETWPIERLIPYARNARTHSPAQIAQIAASIAEFGFNNPVLADPEGGIIAGHGRVLAARQLGHMEVPVVILAHLNSNQKRAFMLADNKLALQAGWDPEILRLELEALAEQDFRLELTGFDERELEELLAGLQQDLDLDPDEAPEVETTAVSRSGDLWILGNTACCAAMEPSSPTSTWCWRTGAAIWCSRICRITWITRARGGNR